MLKIAIVGCGKIADAHVAQIQRLSGREIVAVCDRELLMARQLSERFRIQSYYSDVAEMLHAAHPDVVHITTPPESHFALAKLCLNAGCHVYVEKPFTLYAHEAQELIRLATELNLKLTVGHDDQFSHVARRMRKLIQAGYLGQRVVHMESYYCYEFSDTYAAALLGDKRHWVRRLPGKLLHNIISHGIARLAEHLQGDSPTVIAQGFSSEYLKSRGETEIVDELRVILADESGATAYFTFSSQLRPSLHAFSIYGDKNGLLLNQDQETLIRLRGARHKSYAEKFVPPVNLAGQYLSNLRFNLGRFWARDFQMKSGMKNLIESFYLSIENGLEPPIPYRELLLASRIMEQIFVQVGTTGPHEEKKLSLQTA